ncbi:MAG: hypothetical protein RLZZ471_913, partial [Actinomycetota bacterium]
SDVAHDTNQSLKHEMMIILEVAYLLLKLANDFILIAKFVDELFDGQQEFLRVRL